MYIYLYIWMFSWIFFSLMLAFFAYSEAWYPRGTSFSRRGKPPRIVSSTYLLTHHQEQLNSAQEGIQQPCNKQPFLRVTTLGMEPQGCNRHNMWRLEERKLFLTHVIYIYICIYMYLEPQTTIYKWLFQLDDSKSLCRKWLEITKHPFINGWKRGSRYIYI